MYSVMQCTSVPPELEDEAFLLPHLLSFAPSQELQNDVATGRQTDSVQWSLSATSPISLQFNNLKH